MEEVLKRLKRLEEQNKTIITALGTIVILLDENRKSGNDETLKKILKSTNDVAVKMTMDVIINEMDRMKN